MYTSKNFKSKKEFKQAVENWNNYHADPAAWHAENGDGRGIGLAPRLPVPIEYFQPGPFGGNEPRDGVLYFEGPHFPQAHKWYAQAVAKDGVIVKVK